MKFVNDFMLKTYEEKSNFWPYTNTKITEQKRKSNTVETFSKLAEGFA